MGRSRSAEQTARVLLSNAVRYDTWECKAASDVTAGPLLTLKFAWDDCLLEPPFHDAVALHMTLYDRAASAFVGATYTVPRAAVADPIMFQSRAENALLVVEVVARDERRSAAVEGERVMLWGYIPLAELRTSQSIALRPGTAQLLQLNSKSWPSAGDERCCLKYTCAAVDDAVLVERMSRLVPPGVIVPQSFMENTPPSSSSSFRCVLQNIQLSLTAENAEWRDRTAEWRVAVVAHNGYQQLGHGAEVPLVFDEEAPTPTCTSTSFSTLSNSNGKHNDHKNKSRTGGSSVSTSTYSVVEKLSRHHHHKKHEHQQPSPFLVHSVTPLEIDGLPVHSATSLVLAMRRRRKGENNFEVLGFCVFPLCVMPMKDRDLHVENLPTLHGPFSCRDPRMLMLESASPYGKLPLRMTLTVEYHDTLAADDFSAASLPQQWQVTADQKKLKQPTGEGDILKKPFLKENDLAQPLSTPFVPSGQSMGIISTEEHVVGKSSEAASPLVSFSQPPPMLGETMVQPGDKAAPPTVQPGYPSAADVVTAGRPPATSGDGTSVDVFKMLCKVMEELRLLREEQEAALRSKHLHGRTQKRTDDAGKLLDDATRGIDVVDLSPIPIAISWETRRRIEEDLQPILHPVHGTPLEDDVPTTGQNMTASLCGIRFEGLTVDASINTPEDVCLIFSFGSLPLQTIGPIRTVRIEKTPNLRTFKLYERAQRGGIVWCEPLGAVDNPFLQRFHQNNDAKIYIHVYDALTMFYVGTVDVQMAHFRRPYNAESARVPIDLPLYRDLSLTERNVPSKVFPLVRNAGQLHATLFCVAAKGGLSTALQMNRTVEPPKGSRVIVAKKLPHANLIEQHPIEREKGDVCGKPPLLLGATKPPLPEPSSSSAAAAAAANTTTEGRSGGATVAAAATTLPQQQQQQMTSTGSNMREDLQGMHWKRAQYAKKLYGNGTTMPGVPREHHQLQDASDMEFRLRYLEKQRDEMKSRKISEALMERLTSRHYIYISSCRPEVTRTLFQNPFSSAMQFSLEVDSSAAGAMETVSSPSFYLGPREQTEVVLVVRLNATEDTCGSEPKHLRARLFTDRREVVRIIDVHATLGPPLVDRRFEIYGPAGTEVSKKFFSRLFSSALFPISQDKPQLLARMRGMCAHISITSTMTTAEANAVLDPITQTYITAWEEITVRTTIPQGEKEQRVEYLTLYKNSSMSEVIETWELCIFACQAITSRELPFGQTTTVALPASGIEALYCSHSHVKVERHESSYLLHIRPPEVGTELFLLHALTNHHLAKTLLTVPTVYPTPTYTQTLELTLADTTAPIFRRLQFVHHGGREEVFTVRHNYAYQLRVSPKQFALAPSDTQFVALQIDMLSLPEGQLEGRWPMWIFINNGSDKTVESYLLHVVLRAHRVLHDMP